MLRAEDEGELALCDIEAFGRCAAAVGCGGHDAVALCLECCECLGGILVVLDIYPLVCATHDIHRGVELAAILDGVYLLNAECLAVAHDGAGILWVEHILGHDAHIVCALRYGALKHLLTLLGDKLVHIVESLLEPLVAMLLGA